MNLTKLTVEKQTFFTKCMVGMFYMLQTHHHHPCLRTHNNYYCLTLIAFFCSCHSVYFGLVFKQHGQPISSLH